jgi:uncharacterized repeat protein (TIGR01451 family)
LAPVDSAPRRRWVASTGKTSWARPVLAVLAFTIALLALPAVASASYSSELKRYPYLTDTAGSWATLNWATTRLSTAGVVRYGAVGSEPCTAHVASTTRTAMVVGSVSEYQWKAQLSGLSPNTEYCYRIYMGTSPEIDLLGDDPAPHFKTQLQAGSSAPFSFAVFGDWGLALPDGTNPDQARLMSRIAASGARLALTTGDNAYGSGSQLNYGDLYQTGDQTSGVFGPSFWAVPGRSLPIFPAVGNHGFAGASTHINNWPQDRVVATSNGRYLRETNCCVNGTFSASYPSTWYAFDVGNVRFYVLEVAWTSTNPGTSDQYGNDYASHWTPDSPEFKWLQNDLATNSRPYKFAFFHYPMYSDNFSENSDSYLHGPDSLEGMLNKYGVDVAFAGHAHLYERNLAAAGGLPNWVTGGGGAQLEPIANGSATCSPLDAYGIGWSYTHNIGSACGKASPPSEISKVFHFLKVDVSDTAVTIRPTDELGRTFDVQTFQHVTGNSDLQISSSDSPDPAVAGNTVTYALNVRNNGPSNARGVTVTDRLPTGVDYVSATPSSGSCSQLSGIVTCSLGPVANGGTATIAVKVKTQNDGTITNQATVVGDDLNDPTSSNSSTSESTTVQPGADLSITKSDSPDPVGVGETLTYGLSVHNNGNVDAANVLLTDNLPSGLTYQSATPSQGTCSEAGGAVTCSLGGLANGADATVDIEVIPQAPATITNTASVRADQLDGNDANNSASQSTTVLGLADLAITKSASPDPVGVGQTLTYTLTVVNGGPNDAPSVRATDSLPSIVAYQSASASQGSCTQVSGTVTCNLGSLANGATATVTIKVKPKTAGTISNAASVAGTASIDRNSANDTASASTTVKAVADLSITNADSPDPVPAGKPLTYAIKAHNNGPSNATGVTVTDPLPASVSLVSVTTKRGTCFQSTPGTVVCSIGNINKGETIDVQIKVTPQIAGTISNTATISGDQLDPSASNDSATATTNVTPSADVAVTKTVSPSTPFVGDTMIYTLSIKNNGPSPATVVTATDPLPTGHVAYQSLTTTQGSCSQSAGTVTCALGNLASGATATVTINVTAIKDGATDNKATVKANEPDPTGGNNASTAHSDIQK